jgi:hypothetical protein
LLLLELAEPAPTSARPIAVAEQAALEPGQLVEIAGFGWTEAGTAGELLSAVVEVAGVEATYLEVTGGGVGGACGKCCFWVYLPGYNYRLRRCRVRQDVADSAPREFISALG